MTTIKTKTLERIEQQLDTMDDGSLRRHCLQCARDFKTSWIELGRALYAVSKNKAYRDWGFNTFEGYAAKEVGIRRQTALKLIRSYMFLEKEESWYLEQKEDPERPARQEPGFEAVDVLRQAKNKKEISKPEYDKLRTAVFDDGKDHREVKKDLTQIIRSREEVDPEEEREKRRATVIKRFVSNLRSAKMEMETLKLVPNNLLKEAEALISKFEEVL